MLTALTVSDLGDSRKDDNDMSRVSIITTMWDNVLTPERVNIRFEQLKAADGPCRVIMISSKPLCIRSLITYAGLRRERISSLEIRKYSRVRTVHTR